MLKIIGDVHMTSSKEECLGEVREFAARATRNVYFDSGEDNLPMMFEKALSAQQQCCLQAWLAKDGIKDIDNLFNDTFFDLKDWPRDNCPTQSFPCMCTGAMIYSTDRTGLTTTNEKREA